MKSVMQRLIDSTRVIADSGGCWLWRGKANRAGYGQMQIDGRLKVVHRPVSGNRLT